VEELEVIGVDHVECVIRRVRNEYPINSGMYVAVTEARR